MLAKQSSGNELIADDLIFYASPEDWQQRSAEVDIFGLDKYPTIAHDPGYEPA